MKNINPSLWLAILTMSLLAAMSCGTTKTSTPSKHRIVIQITTPDTAAYRSTMRQINNILAKWPDAQIEVVAHNKGIGMLETKKSNIAPELGALKEKGVQFLACEQTLAQQKIDKQDILPQSGFVERGLIHIIERQEQAWAYIKGGF